MSRKDAAGEWSEAELQRRVKLDLGRTPDLLIRDNVVGLMFKPTIVPVLRGTLARAGANPDDVRAVLDTIHGHRVMCGLGVGSPDLVFSVAGRAGWIELKTADGEVSEEQEAYHRAARARGWPGDVARSVDEARAVVERVREGGR